MRTTLWIIAALAATSPVRAADEPPTWVESVQKVHANFTGKPGTLALFGDSITVSRAFWSPLASAPKDLPDPIAKSLAVVNKYLIDDCWSKWRGAEYGSDGGK